MLLIAGGTLQIAIVSSVSVTYRGELAGVLLMGLGAGLLIPAATDAVLGAVTQDDAGVGSAMNSMAIQVGGAIEVAVIGSVLSTRYKHILQPALVGQHVPAAAVRVILGSIGGALAVAHLAGGTVGAALAHTARIGFSQGSHTAYGCGRRHRSRRRAGALHPAYPTAGRDSRRSKPTTSPCGRRPRPRR